MLRTAIAALGALCVIGGVVLLLSPSHAGIAPLVIGALILLSLVFEGRYRAAKSVAGPWQRTGERFIDPETGKLVEVDYDPKTGERRYRSS